MIDIKQHSLYKPMEVDSVLSNIFNIYLKNFLVLFLSSFAASLVIQIVFYQLGFLDLTEFTDPEEILSAISGMRNEIIIGSITYFVVYGILVSFLINFLIRNELNPETSLLDSFIHSVKNNSIHLIFFLILSLIIVILGIFIGVFAFIIGSFVAMIYLGTALVSGGAVVVAEEKNAFEAIGRSFTLSHKDFWSTLGAIILYFLIIILISIVLSAISFVFKFISNWQNIESFKDIFNIPNRDIGSWVVVLNSAVAAITYPFYAILSVVLYFKLKFIEDKRTTVS